MKEVFLHNPTYLQLDDAYRSLPVLKPVLVNTSKYEQTLHDLEKIGFVAIQILNFSRDGHDQTIRAYKGKHGPCYFTGKKAIYTGSATAIAVLDDDNHLLFQNISLEVCDKTFRVFGLEPYQGLIYTENDSQDSPASVVVKNDFETATARLYDQLKNIKKSSGPGKVLFYPGPFRLLILADGSMVYRGKWSNVPADRFKDLVDKNGCIISRNSQIEQKIYFQDEYAITGSACLLKNFSPEPSQETEYETDFSMLSTITAEFKQRLVDVIDNQRKYFILIGNELENKMGCCPSEEVTEANRLVKHGILSSMTEPLRGDSCPVTLYAFRNELSVDNGGIFCSKINESFRDQIRSFLEKSPFSTVRNVLKWVLIAFIIFSLAFAARKCQSLQTTTVEESIYEQLNPAPDNTYLAILFHNRKRCYQCQQMEKYAREVILETSNANFASAGLDFKAMVIDDPDNVNIVKTFGIFAPTIVLLEFGENELVRSEVLFELTGMYREEEVFKTKLSMEIHQFLTENE